MRFSFLSGKKKLGDLGFCIFLKWKLKFKNSKFSLFPLHCDLWHHRQGEFMCVHVFGLWPL